MSALFLLLSSFLLLLRLYWYFTKLNDYHSHNSLQNTSYRIGGKLLFFPLQILLLELTWWKTYTGLNVGFSVGKDHSVGIEHATSSSSYLLPNVI